MTHFKKHIAITSPPKVTWKERIATPRWKMHSPTACASCTMRNEALRERCSSLWNVTELLRNVTWSLWKISILFLS